MFPFFVYQEICGQNYFGVCEEYRDASERRPLILEGMRSAVFDDVTGRPFQITPEGNGATGYQFYMLQQGTASDVLYYDIVCAYCGLVCNNVDISQQLTLYLSITCLHCMCICAYLDQ